MESQGYTGIEEGSRGSRRLRVIKAIQSKAIQRVSVMLNKKSGTGTDSAGGGSDRTAPVWISSGEPLRQWYASVLGQSILEALDPHLDRILPRIFGYQGIQLGQLSNDFDIVSRAGIHRTTVLDGLGAVGDPTVSGDTDESAGVEADLPHGVDISGDVLNLPVATDIMKLAVLPHTLDFCHQPHQALREADRILTDDGHIVIIGFNPLSGFGVRHLAARWRGSIPWNGQFYSRRRVTEWLSVLNYRVLDSASLFVRPPVNHAWILQKTRRIEKLQPWIGGIGGLYIIHARKETIPVTPAKHSWHRQRAGLQVGGFARTANQNVSKSVTSIVKADQKRQD